MLKEYYRLAIHISEMSSFMGSLVDVLDWTVAEIIVHQVDINKVNLGYKKKRCGVDLNPDMTAEQSRLN